MGKDAFDSTAWGMADVPPPIDTKEPAREAAFVSDVIVPLAQAVITGALFGSVLAVGIAASGAPDKAMAAWAVSFALVTLLSWLALLVQTRRILWGIEKKLGIDLDKDGHKGKPPEDPTTIEVVIRREGGGERIVPPGWLGLNDPQLLALADDLYRGRGTTEGDIGQDRFLFPRGVKQWREVRAKLEEAGLLAKNNPEAASQGFHVTKAGKAVFDQIRKHGK
jgi:hypothetical protein